jgi:excinuclease ABC subunit B
MVDLRPQHLHHRERRAEWNRPTIVISHNKTLAAQLYGEFRQFSDDAVGYFISYYDYCQPEAGPVTNTTRHDASIDDIDRSAPATLMLLERTPIIVASVSCIYGPRLRIERHAHRRVPAST